MRLRQAIAFVLAVSCAGCFSASDQVVASASGARLSFGWAYDGVGLQDVPGTVQLDAQDSTNTGSVRGVLGEGADEVRFDWTRFAASQPFQDGGIAFDVDEHGDTGNGDTALPRLHALAAGWGETDLILAGRQLPNPAGGPWRAHFMLTDTAVRHADGRITNAAGDAPYDPLRPAGGGADSGRTQLLLAFRSGPLPAAAPLDQTFGGMVTGTGYSRNDTFTVEDVGATLTLTIDVDGPAPPATNLTFLLYGPEGIPFGSFRTPSTPTAPVTGTIVVGFAHAGQYSLAVSGRGVGATYTAHATTQPRERGDERLFVLTFDDVVVD